jgi:hypothetical protein
MNIALCFAVKNCEKYLTKIFQNIEYVKTLDFNIYSIFVFDNCNDHTEYLLNSYKNMNKNNNVIIKKIINDAPQRTVRIAKARNECLNTVYNELKDISFHIMIDSDDKGAVKWNIDTIDRYLNNFDNDDWDCISFNRTQHDPPHPAYFDIWALLYDDFKHHCFGYGPEQRKTKHVLTAMRSGLFTKLKNTKGNSTDVISAFNGFAIYKTDRFKGFYYDGLIENFKKLITDTERDGSVKAFKKYFNLDVFWDDGWNLDEPIPDDQSPGQVCEHLFYHMTAHKAGRKIKVSKYIIM